MYYVYPLCLQVVRQNGGSLTLWGQVAEFNCRRARSIDQAIIARLSPLAHTSQLRWLITHRQWRNISVAEGDVGGRVVFQGMSFRVSGRSLCDAREGYSLW